MEDTRSVEDTQVSVVVEEGTLVAGLVEQLVP